MMRATHQRLYINIDHVATVREARRSTEPDPIAAALACEDAGADGITAHLREDRRHIQDDDVQRLVRTVRTLLNLEMACTSEMLDIAIALRPRQVTLVPERREEVTTEGGLDLTHDPRALEAGIRRMRDAALRVSLFIAPSAVAARTSRELGADAIELHTGQYAHHPDDVRNITSLRDSAAEASALGLAVHAGHGLNLANVGRVAAIPEIEELNIGHSIIGRAIMVGIAEAVREMRRVMDEARHEHVR